MHKLAINHKIIGIIATFTCLKMQGFSVSFACVGSGDPVRVLRLYTTNTLDIL